MTINSTDAIKASNSNVSKYEKEIREEQAKKREQAEKEKVARELVDNLSQYTEAKSVKSVQKDLKAALKEQKELKMISEEEYKQAMSYVKSKDFKESVKEDITSESRTYVAGLAGKSEAVKAKEMQKDVKDVLKEQYDNGEITKEQYDAYKKYASGKNGFVRFFGVKENEANKLYKGNSADNNVDKVRKEGPKFSDEMQAKINVSGYTVDELYEIYENNGGAADGTINYSWKKKQPGERDEILTKLNENKGEYKFDMKDVKEIGKALGYNVEKAVDAGKVVRDGLAGGIVGSATLAKQTQNLFYNGTIQATQKQIAGIAGPVLGVATGVTASVLTQKHRVEDRAIPTNVPEDVKTYEDYTKYVDTYATEKGAGIGKDIAKFYIDKRDGKTLLLEQMNKDLAKAAGTVDAVGTPLNYEEALGLLSELSSGKKVVEQPKPVEFKKTPEKETCFIEVKANQVKEKEAVPTDCYTVKYGDDWYRVVMGKYQPKSPADAKALVRYLKDAYYEENKEDLNKLGIKSSKGAFFPKVGAELYIPSEITINGTKYEYLQDGKVNAGNKFGNTVTYNAEENPFYRIENKTKYDVSTCNGKVAEHIEESQVQPTIDNIKKDNSKEWQIVGWGK